MYEIRFDRFSILGLTIQLMQQSCGSFHSGFRSAYLKLITTVTNVYRQSFFEVFEILINRATQGTQALGIVRFEHHPAGECNDAGFVDGRRGVRLFFQISPCCGLDGSNSWAMKLSICLLSVESIEVLPHVPETGIRLHIDLLICGYYRFALLRLERHW